MSRLITGPLTGFKAAIGGVSYTFGRLIGQGSFGKVYCATKEGAPDQTLAIKVIPKSLLIAQNLTNLQREIEIGKRVQHPNVLRLEHVFETGTDVFLVTAYLGGGDLFDRVSRSEGGFSEGDAVRIVRQILSGVQYLHSVEIAHRDIKPENLLCSMEPANFRVVLCDFGLSRHVANGELMLTTCGSLRYLAPEVVQGQQSTNKRDIWSVGVVTYIMLTGAMPFGTQADITSGRYPQEELKHVSHQARSFLSMVLNPDPVKRPSATQCLADEWLTESHQLAASGINLRDSAIRISKNFVPHH